VDSGRNELNRQCNILTGSALFDAAWYLARYPDVAETGLDPALHYLKYGAALGRDPAPGFETRFYLETYPDIAASGANPLVHFVTQGHREGRCPAREVQAQRDAARQIALLRENLLNLGLDTPALRDLEHLAEAGEPPALRALAAQELALWSLRLGDAEAALARIAPIREEVPTPELLLAAELLALDLLDRRAPALALYDYAQRRGRAGPDAALIMANFEPHIEGRVAAINRVLQQFDLPPVQLRATGLTPYDRLQGPEGLARVEGEDPPLVSVLVAAHDAARTLATSVQSLLAQSWSNLEILIVDDCSADETAAVAARLAAQDPRVRLIRAPVNAGAYVARNLALAEATGAFVTLQDADDWSHPLRIELQVRHLLAHPDVLACTSRQARAGEDLCFRRWTGSANILATNTSSLMFRRAPMQARLGAWDAVRISADSELIRRMRQVFGPGSVHELPTGPLALQRDTPGSAVRDPTTGISGFLFGVRREYHDAQRFHHGQGGALHYDGTPGARAFPVPPALLPAAPPPRRFDLVLGGDFRGPGPMLDLACALCEAAAGAGTVIGLFDLLEYDPELGDCGMAAPLRALVQEGRAAVLSFGEQVDCDRLLIGDPRVLLWPQHYLPRLRAREAAVIVPAPEAAIDPARCAAGLRALFDGTPVWHPADAETRAALQALGVKEIAPDDLADAGALF